MDNSLDFDWGNIPFGYSKTDFNVRCYFKDGKWGDLEMSSSEEVSIHMASTALHYGQQAFEGLKAYKGKDGKIRLFRWQENAKRLQDSADGILMEKVPVKLFENAIKKVIDLNQKYVPPYGSGASLYIRPVLFGIGGQVGVRPSTDYLFVVFVTPVGPYFKTGFKPVDMYLGRAFDRAAPQGTGHIKVGGNYASSLVAMKEAHDNGFANVLFLDSKEKKYIDECGPANFFGIKNKTYITPKSNSILPSITNKSLMQLAEHIGLKVERREVPLTELETFEEVGACGTAAVITPIGRVIDKDTGKEYVFTKDNQPGKYSTQLYELLYAIQTGDAEDVFNWVEIL